MHKVKKMWYRAERIIINQKKEKQVTPQCTPEKEKAIMDALRHFKMI